MKNSHLNKMIRLQKYLADCGVASRRKSEKLIKEGRVKVNNIIVCEMGHKIFSNDAVTVDDKEVISQKKIYIVINKPVGVICSHKDHWKRKTVYDIIGLNEEKLFSAGRLDYNSSGLLLITNDGDFANNIIHPSKKIIKEYYVDSVKNIPGELINKFINGIKIKNVLYKAVNIKKIKKNSVFIYLNEGKKREIREVFKEFTIPVKTLKRTAIGNLRLKNININEGEFKFFSQNELLNKIKEDRK